MPQGVDPATRNTDPHYDAGAERDSRPPKPCGERLIDGGRCAFSYGHALFPGHMHAPPSTPLTPAQILTTTAEICAGYTKGMAKK